MKKVKEAFSDKSLKNNSISPKSQTNTENIKD